MIDPHNPQLADSNSRVVREGRMPTTRVVICSSDTGLAKDYCQFQEGNADQPGTVRISRCIRAEDFKAMSSDGAECPEEIVVFLNRQMDRSAHKVLAEIARLSATASFRCLIVFPSLLHHLSPGTDDEIQEQLDRHGQQFGTRRVLPGCCDLKDESCVDDPNPSNGEHSGDFRNPEARLIVVRTGYVISPSSELSRRLNRFRNFRRLLHPKLTSTFVEGSELFRAINEELDSCCSARSGIRQITIPGPRRSWRSMFTDSQPSGLQEKLQSLVAMCLAAIGVSWLLYRAVLLLSRLFPPFRPLHFHTLRPQSVRELISLYNRHSCGNIQIAGYNNGVNHFGWQFPGRTVVLTTGIPGKTQLSDTTIPGPECQIGVAGDGQLGLTPHESGAVHTGTHFTVDAGLTLNHCIKELSRLDREFFVVPNYSWISMGTLFFVPVHGSGSRVSTLGDTIEAVFLYDGDEEQFILARRGDAIFRDAMYNTSQHLLLLRLTLQVKPKSVYSMRKNAVENPSAEQIMRMFEDTDASNVEIRKSSASGTSVDVFQYFEDASDNVTDAMAIPRDSIGRLWDRLEETPIVSALFHWFVRTFAFHVELMLRPDEFSVFWQHHQTLPVSKIQLRRVLKDGITHSACVNENCISADLFMMRRDRDAFCRFIATHMPNVRSNPGKQTL